MVFYEILGKLNQERNKTNVCGPNYLMSILDDIPQGTTIIKKSTGDRKKCKNN